ncbi:peptidyl-prolyl cis-trans isomerase FKBP43 [Tanacetum coccineum]
MEISTSRKEKKKVLCNFDIGSLEILKSSVKCSVGGKRAVLLCTLVPNKIESMPLDLEFDETEDVKFSVIGSIGVYLTGYCIGPNQETNANNDIESDAEDISNSESLRSDYSSDNYNNRDSFIDDDFDV